MTTKLEELKHAYLKYLHDYSIDDTLDNFTAFIGNNYFSIKHAEELYLYIYINGILYVGDLE